MYTYHSLKELFDLADKAECSPGIIACRAEAEESGKSCEEVWNRMKKTIPVFRNAIRQGLSDTGKSASGLVGGDASRLYHGKMRFLSPICQRAASYALATAESNAKMHRVVACPTAVFTIPTKMNLIMVTSKKFFSLFITITCYFFSFTI